MDNLQTGKGMTVPRLSIIALAIVTLLSLGLNAQAQTPTTSTTINLVGEVKAVDATAKQLVLRADSGVISTVNLSEKTQYKRLPPGETTLTKATDVTLADVGPAIACWPGGDPAPTSRPRPRRSWSS